MTRKGRRLTLIGIALAIIGGAVGLAAYALKDNIVFFYGPTEVLQKNPAAGTRLRMHKRPNGLSFLLSLEVE